jgi:hypothetical protein
MPESNTKRHGLIVQKIKGAWDIKLRQKGIVHLVGVLDNSNNQSLEDLKHLQGLLEYLHLIC